MIDGMIRWDDDRGFTASRRVCLLVRIRPSRSKLTVLVELSLQGKATTRINNVESGSQSTVGSRRNRNREW